MSASDLFGVVTAVSAQYAALLGLVISLNFAMIVAVWTFLHRAHLGFRHAAFAFYLVGMGLLGGMLVQQARIKDAAVAALRALPPAERAGFVDGYLATQDSGLFAAVALFQPLALVLLVVAVAWLLFAWKGERL